MDAVELTAYPGKERRLPCGCAVVLAVPRRINNQARFQIGEPELVLIPCNQDDEHIARVRGRLLWPEPPWTDEFEELVEAGEVDVS